MGQSLTNIDEKRRGQAFYLFIIYFDTNQREIKVTKSHKIAGLNRHWFISTRDANLATDQTSFTTKMGN